MAQDIKERKFEAWKHGLLDVSKRNKMINYRKTKRATLKILSPDFCALFDRLVLHEESISFKMRVDCSQDKEISRLFYLMDKVGSPVEIIQGEMDTDVPVDESNRTLKHLRSKAKQSFEEQGINILYLSFDFLEWKQKPSEKEMLAPLVLVPVELTISSRSDPYVLSKLDEDIVVNPTLAYVLSSDFGIELPDFDPSKNNIVDYLNGVKDIVMPMGWRVLQEANLGLLSYLKIVMYRDLEKYKDRIFENPIINAFCGDDSGLPQWSPELVRYPHDRDSAMDMHQVVNADSSQQDAIRLSKQGYSFVLQGPPGTGKSQTITNIIAEGLADGKKILFVSEKMAALSVVYHRLQEVNLSEYCLSLHNYKADKKKVIAELVDSLDAPRQILKTGVMDFVTDYEQQRKELNEYFAVLKKEREPLNRSLYDVLTELCMLEDVPLYNIPDPVLEVTRQDYKEKLISLRQYKEFLEHYPGDIRNNPWRDTNIGMVTLDLQKSIEQMILEMSPAMMGICSVLDYMQEDYGTGRDWNWVDYCNFIQTVAYARTLSEFSHKLQEYYTEIFKAASDATLISDLSARYGSLKQELTAQGLRIEELDTEKQRRNELKCFQERWETADKVCSFMKEFNQTFSTGYSYDVLGFQKQMGFL
ncbi:MAG: DUF4011 domain-containing protein [Clostridiales bacterium]|nr:DUF4011 domain-containing protein [Clostridiales bacterium]